MCPLLNRRVSTTIGQSFPASCLLIAVAGPTGKFEESDAGGGASFAEFELVVPACMTYVDEIKTNENDCCLYIVCEYMYTQF